MNNIVSLNGPAEAVTMTSLELVDFINSKRKPGEPELRHDNFMAKVPKVLGEAAPKFLGTAPYTNGTGAQVSRQIYIFPKREACLMAMSYSYELQAQVFDHMTALEQKLQNVSLPPAVASQVGGIVKAVIHKELANLLPEMVHAEMAKKHHSIRHGETAGQIWKRHGLPTLKNGAGVLSRWLCRAGCNPQGRADMGGRSVKIFDPDLADRAMRDGVSEWCWKYVVERRGQTALPIGGGRGFRTLN